MVTTDRPNKQPGEPRASLLVEQYEKQTFAIFKGRFCLVLGNNKNTPADVSTRRSAASLGRSSFNLSFAVSLMHQNCKNWQISTVGHSELEHT